MFCYFYCKKIILLNELRTPPMVSSCHKLSNGILFAKFESINLREFDFELAVIKQISK
jgi:hypothetical protein